MNTFIIYLFFFGMFGGLLFWMFSIYLLVQLIRYARKAPKKKTDFRLGREPWDLRMFQTRKEHEESRMGILR